MRGETAHKAYQRGSQYGKFNSLYGTGDHPREGGKIVEGVSGKIHIMGGSDDGEFSRVEGDIMKANPKEGEYILAQRNGYGSLDEVPVDETTGYRKYGWLDDVKEAATDFLGNTPAAQFYGAAAEGISGAYDKYIGDPMQQALGIGEYSEEAQRNEKLEEMLGTQTESAIAGQKKMEGFIESNLQEQMSQFGSQAEMLSTAGKRLDTKTTGVQAGIAGQYGGARDITQKTGLVTGGPTGAMKGIETAGKAQMADIGLGRRDILTQRGILESKKRGAVTQADMDKYKSKASTQQALASMISDYMTVSGEEVDDTMMTQFMEYMEDTV